MIKINTIQTNILREQTYILSDETNECVIIDPGFQTTKERDAFTNFIKQHQLTLKAIWLTHMHFDHIMGAEFIINNFNIPVFGNVLDLPLINGNKILADSWGIETNDFELSITNEVKDGDILNFGKSKMTALHVPGHSQGSIVYYSSEDKFCIGGDVLFCGSIGRSDLPGGNGQQLIDGIKQKLLVLPDDTTVFPGHGQATTIGDERRYNPYLQPQI